MAGLAGLESLPNLLHQSAEGLADFGEILAFICETLENEANLLVLPWSVESVQSLLPST